MPCHAFPPSREAEPTPLDDRRILLYITVYPQYKRCIEGTHGHHQAHHADLSHRAGPEGLRTAAEREHRSMANMVEVMIRDYCGHHRITIRSSSTRRGPQTATARTIRSHNGPQEIRALLLSLAKLRRTARRHGRLAVQGLRAHAAVRQVRVGQVRRQEGRAAQSSPRAAGSPTWWRPRATRRSATGSTRSSAGWPTPTTA